MTGDLGSDSGMAHFDTEYQRLEASYSDSPPGEENLLVHVPEGSKCKIHNHLNKAKVPYSVYVYCMTESYAFILLATLL